jgi:hypothetical protein
MMLRPTFKCIVVILAALWSASVIAHPLGNFSVNQYARLEVGAERITIRYVCDMAELPAFQELQTVTTHGASAPTKAELNAYLERVAAQYADGLRLTVDGMRVPLRVLEKTISQPPGAGKMPTLRVEMDVAGDVPAGGGAGRVRFENENQRDRAGWREIVVVPLAGATVFNASAFGSGVTDELKSYPENLLVAPLDERAAEFSFAAGPAPAGAAALLTREGRPAGPARERFAPPFKVSPVFLIGLCAAASVGLAACYRAFRQA